jgi:hypothetical protein
VRASLRIPPPLDFQYQHAALQLHDDEVGLRIDLVRTVADQQPDPKENDALVRQLVSEDAVNLTLRIALEATVARELRIHRGHEPTPAQWRSTMPALVQRLYCEMSRDLSRSELSARSPDEPLRLAPP